MPDLSKANAARLAAALDKPYRFSHGVDTLRGMIAAGRFSHAEAATVPRIEYNRLKFNRMDSRQQAEYERKLKETKTEYRLIYAADSDRYIAAPKMVFDYFQAQHANA
jgi:hypothetical protein